jgi:Fic family protein
MHTVLDQIAKLSSELQALLPMNKEYKDKLDEKYKLEFNYNSNHIEGNTLTYGQTKLLLIFGETSGNADFKDYEEMKAHNVGIEMIRREAADKNRPLTESFIRELNKTILVENYWKFAQTESGDKTKIEIKVGEYKSRPNSVITQTGEKFNYASPEETPAMMNDLVKWFNTESENKTYTPIELATLLHYRYIRIHPFEDGNGRIARLLVNYVLLRNDLPPIIIKSKEKSDYLKLLHQCDIETGLEPFDGANAPVIKLHPFLLYLQNLLIESLEMSIKAAKGENISEIGDLDKKIKLLENELSQIDEDEEVKSHFNKDIFMGIMDSWGKSIIITIIPTIKKFNIFFTESNHHIGCSSVWESFVNESENDIFTAVIAKLDDSISKSNFQMHNCTIEISAHYGSLKKGGLNTFGCNYGCKVKFDLTKYEVFVDEFSKDGLIQNKLFEKLLHKPLLDSEIEIIKTKLGEAIYNHIDYYTKEKGLR